MGGMNTGARQTRQKLEDMLAEWIQQLYPDKLGEGVADDRKIFEHDENGTLCVKRMTTGARQTQQMLEDMPAAAEWMHQLYADKLGEGVDDDYKIFECDENGTSWTKGMNTGARQIQPKIEDMLYLYSESAGYHHKDFEYDKDGTPWINEHEVQYSSLHG